MKPLSLGWDAANCIVNVPHWPIRKSEPGSEPGSFPGPGRYILAVTRLPVLADADNGYGDHKNGISLLMRGTRTIRETLEDIRVGEMKLSGTGGSFEDYKDIVGMRDWSRIEDKYR